MTKSYKAIELTEKIGATITDLDAAIESIHYDPENATEEDIKTLKEIEQLIKQATKLAERTAKGLK